MGVRRTPKIFSDPGYAESVSKNFFGFLPQNESRIMKKIYPPQKKGPFFLGGGDGANGENGPETTHVFIAKLYYENMRKYAIFMNFLTS